MQYYSRLLANLLVKLSRILANSLAKLTKNEPLRCMGAMGGPYPLQSLLAAVFAPP